MDESPTRPHPRGELQIIRTRHPPAIYLQQLSELLLCEGVQLSTEQLQRYLEMLPESDRILMAVEGEQLVGYAHLSLGISLRFGPFVEISSLVVQSERRREGLGQRLIAAAETWASQSQYDYIRLNNEVVNTSSHAFFTALGFEEQASKVTFIRDLRDPRPSR